jgi:benzoate-CoA ligase
VSPVEVENTLSQHEQVLECAVVGCESEHGLSKPYAFVVVRDRRQAGPELERDLQAFVRDRLAAYKRPRAIEFVSDLPKTSTGKLQRYKLRDSLRSARSS